MMSKRILRGRTVEVAVDEPVQKKVKESESCQPSTRSVTETFMIGYPSDSISGSQLPTNRQALQYFIHLQNSQRIGKKLDRQVFAYETVDAIMPFWQMARIKTMTRKNAMFHFLHLHDTYRNLARNKQRLSDPSGQRMKFESKLDVLFDIGAPDAVLEIQNNRILSQEQRQEDMRFYMDQQNERQGRMSGHDKTYEKKFYQQAVRKEKARSRESHYEGLETIRVPDEGLITSDEDVGNCSTDSTDYEPIPECSHQVHDSTITLKFPRKIMESEQICNIADRMSLSDSVTTAMVSAVLKSGGGDLDDFVISSSTTRRNRMTVRYKLSQKHMADFRENPPKYGALHWDGKLLKDVLGAQPGSSTDILAILVSGSPQYNEGKLIGVPTIDRSTGIEQANASMNLLIAWELTDVIVALVFDTTASNSGIHKGAAKLLEEKLDRKVFYLACRHHILEVIVGGVWEKIFEKVKSPDNPWFKEMKDAWSGISKEHPKTLKISRSRNCAWLQQRKEETLEVLQEKLSESNSPRADYREVAELTIILLGETPPRGIHWSRPGAIHQARWMARNLYCMKMFMFSDALQYDGKTQEKLRRINSFLSLFYATHWMTATCAADAPFNDLQLVLDMLEYEKTDKELAHAVLNKMKNQGWYLTQELITFTLFSSNKKVTSSLKEELAAKLINTEKPEEFRKGKPIFPTVTRDTTLTELIGPESHFLFHALNIGSAWLTTPADSWSLDEDFLVAQHFVRTVKVVNDTAERGVKMMSDFANIITTDPQQRDYLLQAVEFNRKRFATFKKGTLNE